MGQSELVKSLISHFGSQVKTGEALNCTQPLISDWLNEKKPVSPIMAMRIEKKTAGEFKASEFNEQVKEFEHP